MLILMFMLSILLVKTANCWLENKWVHSSSAHAYVHVILLLFSFNAYACANMHWWKPASSYNTCVSLSLLVPQIIIHGPPAAGKRTMVGILFVNNFAKDYFKVT